MRVAYRALVIAALLMSSSVCVLANSIQWTFNQASFSDGNVVTGSFITNSAVTAYLSFSITVSNAGTPADAFTATQMTETYLPTVIGFANADFSRYIDLDAILTSAGGLVPITAGFDSPNGTFRVGGDFHPSVNGVTLTPEPSAIVLVTAGLGLLGLARRRKLVPSRLRY